MATLQTDDLADWLRLASIPGVGRESARKLLSSFGLPADIFKASHAALASKSSDRIASAVLQAPDEARLALIHTTLEWASQAGNYVLTLADSNYPPSLFHIPDPPLLLYVKGRLELLNRRAIAIVGSRHATTQGYLDAEKFAEALSHAGLCIVSGLASGIDTAAHQGGLRGASSTIAVIGTGADIVYPAKNRALAHKIAQDGCIISEYALGTPAIASNFPRRNRIISGLSSGVLVVEAALQSGSLITARTANEQGRDVFALPGSIHAPLAKGCHQLIKQGAKLVECVQDILDELSMATSNSAQAPLALQPTSEESTESTPATAEQALLALIGFSPLAFDTLASRSQLDAATLTSQLLNLELDGLLERLPDGRYQRLS